MLQPRQFLVHLTIEAHDYAAERKSYGHDNEKLGNVEQVWYSEKCNRRAEKQEVNCALMRKEARRLYASSKPDYN